MRAIRTPFDSPAYRGGFRGARAAGPRLAFTYGKRDDRFSPAASSLPDHREFAVLGTLFREPQHVAGAAVRERLIGIDPENGVFIDERSDTPFDPRPDPFDIDDETEYIKAARADLTFSRGRYSAGLRGYLGREETVSTGDDQDVWRIDAILSRAIGRQLTFDLSGGAERVQFAGGRDDDEYRIQPGFRYLLNPRATLFLDYRYLWQNSNDPTAEYTENRVAVGLRLAW